MEPSLRFGREPGQGTLLRNNWQCSQSVGPNCAELNSKWWILPELPSTLGHFSSYRWLSWVNESLSDLPKRLPANTQRAEIPQHVAMLPPARVWTFMSPQNSRWNANANAAGLRSKKKKKEGKYHPRHLEWHLCGKQSLQTPIWWPELHMIILASLHHGFI